jgi:hypothetical protein
MTMGQPVPRRAASNTTRSIKMPNAMSVVLYAPARIATLS